MDNFDNTWVKLYRKLAENDIMRDATALQVFVWILLHVDKKTGTYTTGRFLLGDVLEIKPSTARDAIYRLRDKYKIIDTNSDNKKTKISLLNWAKYQPSKSGNDTTDDTSPTHGRQQTDTKQEYKNKNIPNGIQGVWDFYLLHSNTKEKLTDGRTTKIKARLKVFTIEEIQTAIEHCFKSKFHTGTNDRGWKANADYVFRSDEIIDNLKNLNPKEQEKQNGFSTPEELKAKGLLW